MTMPTTELESDAGKPGAGVQMVQSLGLFSATTLVVGSMIGSGIFIVDCDIARLTDSPALYLAAWVVTAVMTMICALSYGELAAMMPKAGGQYVYLRESLGPLWGFLYGWTLFLVIETGTIAAVCVAFGKFLGVFFPAVSSTHWLWHIAHVPAIPIGPMVLGNMEIGISTANLAGIAVVLLLATVNIFGMKFGALVQNVFTVAKALSLAGLIVLGFTVGRNALAIAANFGDHWSQFWRNAGWSTLHPVQVGAQGPLVMVNLIAILAVVQVGSLFSADAWNNVTFTAGEIKHPRRNVPLSLALGTGFVLVCYILASTAYIMVLPLHGDPHGATVFARGVQYAAEDRIGAAVLRADFSAFRRLPDGGGDHGVDVRVRQRYYALRGAGVLCNGARRALLQVCRQAASALPHSGSGADCAGNLDNVPVRVRVIRPTARLHYLCGAGLLHSDAGRTFRAACKAARCAAALQGFRLSSAAGAVYLDGDGDLRGAAALQAAIHLAGVDSGAAGGSGLPVVVKRSKREREGGAGCEWGSEWGGERRRGRGIGARLSILNRCAKIRLCARNPTSACSSSAWAQWAIFFTRYRR